jgi:endonuclease-3
MSTPITPAIHLARVYNLLVETYGEPINEPDYDPLGGLIGTILSQHTSDVNSERAYERLIEAFPAWEAVRDAQTSEVAEAIRCGGLANVKAPRIQDALQTLTDWQQAAGYVGSLSQYLSDTLTGMTPEEGWRFLRKIVGVGPKTAACVLMFNMNEPVMPIDTHVHRVSKRLGLIGSKVSADQAHDVFARMVPPEWVYPLHVNLIRHGRQICHAQKPACETCTLYSECTFVGSVNVQEETITG